MKGWVVHGITAIVLISAILFASIVPITSLASTSVSTQTTVSIEQLKAEALLLKIMIERALSVYVVPSSVKEEAEKLISINVSKLTNIELQKYIENCSKVLNLIKHVGRVVNVVNVTEVGKKIAEEVAKRIEVLSKILNISVNTTIIKKLRHCKSFTEMVKVIAMVKAELTPMFIEKETHKLMKMLREKLARNLTYANVEIVEKKLKDVLKMLNVLNKSIILINKTMMLPPGIKKHIEILLMKIKNESKELKDIVEKIAKEIEKIRLFKHIEKGKKVSTEQLRSLKHEVEVLISKLSEAMNATNSTVRVELEHLLEKLKQDLKLINEVLSGKVSVEHVTNVVKEVLIDVAKAKTLLATISITIVTKVSATGNITKIYKNISIDIEYIISIARDIEALGKELNMSKLTEVCISIEIELEKLSQELNKCLSLKNESAKLECLHNVVNGMRNSTLTILHTILIEMTKVYENVKEIAKNISMWQNVTKEVNSYVNATLVKIMNMVRNVSAYMNASMYRIASSNVTTGELVRILNKARAMLVSLKRVYTLIPIINEYKVIVIEVENVSRILQNMTKSLPSIVPTEIKNLEQELKNLINECLKYLLKASKSIAMHKVSEAKHYLDNAKHLVKLMLNALKELEYKLSSYSSAVSNTTSSAITRSQTSTTMTTTTTVAKTRCHG